MDTELRDKIVQHLFNAAVWREHVGAAQGEAEYGDKRRLEDKMEGSRRVADLILDLFQQEIAKARIEELTSLEPILNYMGDQVKVNKRIAELTKTLKEHKE